MMTKEHSRIIIFLGIIGVLFLFVVFFTVITGMINVGTSESYTLTNVQCGKNTDGSYDPNENSCNKDILCSRYSKFWNDEGCEKFIK
jgi:hypothetical protein